MHSDENLPAAWSATKNAGTPPELDEIVPGSWWRITGAFKDFAEREAPDHGLIFLLGDVRIIDGEIHTVVLHEHPRFGGGTVLVLIEDLLVNFTHAPNGEELRAAELAELMGEITEITEKMSSPPSDADLIKSLPAPAAESAEERGEAQVPSVLLPSGDVNAAQRKVETAIAVLEARQSWVEAQTAEMQEKMYLVANFQKEKVSLGLAGISEQRKMAETMLANVQTMRLWLGEEQDFISLVRGQGAGPADKLHFMQRMLYLDEELFTHSRLDGFNGDDMMDLPHLLQDNPDLVARMLPFNRCVAIAKVRRSARPFNPPTDVSALLALISAYEQDQKIHILIRNGEQVSMVTTDEITSKANRLFPSKAEIDAIFTERARFGTEARMITPQDVEYSDKRADHDSRALFYKRVLLILWGLAERENIFGDFIGKQENWLEQDVHAKSFTFVHDEEGVIHDGRPSVMTYLKENRARIRSGTRVLAQWSKVATEDSAPQIFDTDSNRSFSFRKVNMMEDFGLTTVETRGDALVVKCPVSKRSYNDNEKTYHTPVKMAWTEKSWGKFNTHTPEGFICIDETSADDLRYYFNSRIHRQNYLEYIHLFDEALRILEAEEKACAAFLRRTVDAGVKEDTARKAIALWRSSSKGASPEGEKAFKKVVQLAGLIEAELPQGVEDAHYAELTAAGALEVSHPHGETILGEEYFFAHVDVHAYSARKGWQKKSERISPLYASAGPGALRLHGEAPADRLNHMETCHPVFRDVRACSVITEGPGDEGPIDVIETMIDPDKSVDTAYWVKLIIEWVRKNSVEVVSLPHLRCTIGYGQISKKDATLYRFEAYVDPIMHLMLKGEEEAVRTIFDRVYRKPKLNFDDLKQRAQQLKDEGKAICGMRADRVLMPEDLLKDPNFKTANLGDPGGSYHRFKFKDVLPGEDDAVFPGSLREKLTRLDMASSYLRAPSEPEKMLERMGAVQLSFFEGCADFVLKHTGLYVGMPDLEKVNDHAPHP